MNALTRSDGGWRPYPGGNSRRGIPRLWGLSPPGNKNAPVHDKTGFATSLRDPARRRTAGGICPIAQCGSLKQALRAWSKSPQFPFFSRQIKANRQVNAL
jgi:hypothetical protein